MPRFTRTLLLLATLSLLIVPTGPKAQAQTEGEITGSVIAGAAASCAEHTPANAMDHKRCARGTFTSVTQVALEATRDVGADLRTATCAGAVPADQAIGFTTRENLAEGRGWISPTELNLGAGSGTVVDADGQGTATCLVRISGTFHRVLTKAIGRLFIDVHVDLGGTRQFRHNYCVRFRADAVPIHDVTPEPPGDPGPFRTLVSATIEGRRAAAGDMRCLPEEAPPLSHGRRPADDADRHGGECPPGHIPDPVVNCDGPF